MGQIMRKLKCLSNFRAGYTFLAAMILGFAFLFTVGGVPSMSNADDVYLELITTGSDNWTQSGSIETFNFTINNTNASLSITQVNISMPLGAGGNADFAVDMSTDDTSDALWGCYNITIDGAGNITLIECNTSSAYLTDGSVISIWFDADAASTSAEDVYQWNVTVLNETNGYVVSQNISGGIDGLAPRISDMGVNVTYVDTDDNIMIWANVTDATFRNASVQAVNASNVTEPCGPDSEIVCESLGGFSRNCTVSGPWGGFEGNYSFNVTSYDNASHSTEVTYPGWFFADLTAPTVTLNYPANGGWDADGDVEFNFTPYDTSLSLANCSVWVGNATGGNWQFNETNGTTLTNNQENNITVYGFSTDADQQVQYIWNVRCWDQVANSSFASQNFTVNVGNRSNIIVESVTFDGPGGKSPYAGKNVTVNVTLLNNGTANVENTTTIRVYFDDDSSPSVDELEKNDTVIVQNTSLTSGSSYSGIPRY